MMMRQLARRRTPGGSRGSPVNFLFRRFPVFGDVRDRFRPVTAIGEVVGGGGEGEGRKGRGRK